LEELNMLNLSLLLAVLVIILVLTEKDQMVIGGARVQAGWNR
jgi:hypothetical protein